MSTPKTIDVARYWFKWATTARHSMSGAAEWVHNDDPQFAQHLEAVIKAVDRLQLYLVDRMELNGLPRK